VSAQLAFFTIDVATAFAAVLLGLRAFQRWRLPTAQLVIVIAFNSFCDVVLGRSDYSYWIPAALQINVYGALAVIFNIARNLTPFLFAAFCFMEFADRPRFPRWLYPLLAIQLFFEVAARWLIPSTAPDIDLRIQAVPSLLQTLFIVMALYWTIAGWRGDLIESRRRARLLLAVAIGINMLLSGIVSRLLVGPITYNTPANYYQHVALVFSHLVLLVFVLFQFADSGIDTYLDPLRRPLPTPPVTNPDTAALARLAALMQDEHLYRRAGLTLKALADRAGIPEYRLRRLIHEQLGFANFNAYLHAFRIREACEQLRDPARRRTPILTVALSVGYQSINTFNRGFREVTGTTPSAWRAASMSDGPSHDDTAPQPASPKTA
jgi:AraC-like DNA-binding protein